LSYNIKTINLLAVTSETFHLLSEHGAHVDSGVIIALNKKIPGLAGYL